jgi:putative ABC transport system permease protein
VFGPAQPPSAARFATVVLRPRSGPATALTPSLRKDVLKADPHLPLYFVGTPQTLIASFVAQNRIIATMFGVFGIVAVVLAAVGIYGVMSFSVNQRRQEFGVRMALGADRRRIMWMVIRQGAIQVAIGTIVGASLAWAIATAMGTGIQTVLFGVSGRDPAVYAAVLAVVAVVALLATLVPARRATRVDPMVALRAD